MALSKQILELARAKPINYKEAIQKILHSTHRHRVRMAKPMIDTKPPLLRTDRILNIYDYRQDLTALQYQVRRNTDLVVDMCGVQRLRSFTEKYARNQNSPPLRSHVPSMCSDLNTLQHRNYQMGEKLSSVKSMVKTKSSSLDSKNSKHRSAHHAFHLPLEILSKYKGLLLPRDPVVLRRLLRPKIFISFEDKNVLLGRMIIQLFTEACPEAVLAFVRICKAQQKRKISLLRIFPSLWLEGELQLEGKCLTTPKIEYDMRALDHGHSAGILSFSISCLHNAHRTLNFALSFKPLSVLNGKRVAFGLVHSGHKVLQLLQNYGTKHGKLRKDVTISTLGIVF